MHFRNNLYDLNGKSLYGRAFEIAFYKRKFRQIKEIVLTNSIEVYAAIVQIFYNSVQATVLDLQIFVCSSTWITKH